MPSTILSDNGVSSGSAGLKTTASNDGSLALQTTTAGGTATTAVTIGTDQSVTFAQAANLPNTFGFKNRIINGAMVIDQRNAGASVTPTSGQYTIDRWWHQLSQTSKISVQRSSTAPAGFVNSALITSLSAYSIGSSDYFNILQNVEGFNVADLGWGTASAQTITVSFWVRSSLTGTFGGAVLNADQSRAYPFTYTISSANTFEYKTVTIAGDTSGTWLKDNSTGLRLSFGLGVGSSFSSTAGSWASGVYLSATGATSVVGTNGATFYITGVQLEKGSTATSFDYRPYGTELALCQRYYAKINSSGGGYVTIAPGTASGASVVGAFVKFPTTMRAAPTFSYANLLLADSAVSSVVSSIGTVYAGNDTANITFNGATANLTTYRPTPVISNNTSAAYLDMTAEL